MTRGLVERFQSRVECNPDARAVVAGQVTLSYAELNERANGIALRLREAGYGPGSFLALGFERSAEMMMVLWAVVKTGAAYIPVDPAYPDKRIEHMAESARWTALLVPPALEKRFRAIPGIGAVCPIDAREAPRCPENPALTAGPDNTLYAIFTSGSTGLPKAATVFRKGFENLLHWYGDAVGLDESSRVLVTSSFSFDLTQKNLFAPLLAGGVVVLHPPGPYDLKAILSEIAQKSVTHVNMTPSAFYPLVDAARANDYEPLATLRAVVLGGEPIATARLRSWLKAPACRAFVANTYGPTECADICAWYRLDRTNVDAHAYVPIGRPIPNVGVGIMDDALRLLPPGELGELCITGIGVGGGYLHDPARTAERFVANPCPNCLPGDRLYRTGDLARINADGVIEFRGRMDQQVKVRGFRIELGEIEQALAAHPSVREAVVTASNTGAEDARLTAWLLPKAERMDTRALRDFLAARVPGYMVPESFVWLDAYPMTPNGKIDRRALQQRASADTRAGMSTPGPVRDGEARVLRLWSEILGRPIEDPTINFFDAGGNSLHLAMLHVQLCEWAGRAFPITDLFVHTTARAQARHVGGASADPRRLAILERAQRQRAVFARPLRGDPA